MSSGAHDRELFARNGALLTRGGADGVKPQACGAGIDSAPLHRPTFDVDAWVDDNVSEPSPVGAYAALGTPLFVAVGAGSCASPCRPWTSTLDSARPPDTQLTAANVPADLFSRQRVGLELVASTLRQKRHASSRPSPATPSSGSMSSPLPTTSPQHDGPLLVVLVGVSRVNQEWRVLCPIDASRVVGAPSDALRRALAVDQAERWLLLALAQKPPCCFLAADLRPTTSYGWTVVIVCSLVAFSRAALDSLAASSQCFWARPKDLCAAASRTHALCGLSAVQSLRGDVVPTNALASAGALAASALARNRPLPMTVAVTLDDRWARLAAYNVQANATLSKALRAYDGHDAAYVNSWADRVQPGSLGPVPRAIWEHALSGYDAPALATLPFANVHMAAVTNPLPRPTRQVTDYRPRSLADIVFPDAITRMGVWLRSVGMDLEGMAADPNYKRKVRHPFVITQEEVRELARGIIWDL